ncbi:MAG: MnhB domain-containing protein [Planctomycetota bacterium]
MRAPPVTSVVLQTSVRLVLPLTLLFAAYMALKGHNEPGGGFIAGLIASVGFLIYRMGFGPEALYRLFPLHPRRLVFGGLTIAMITAVAPLLFGRPLLTSQVGLIDLPGNESLHYATAAIFDIGVLMVVVGVTVGIILRLSEELE